MLKRCDCGLMLLGNESSGSAVVYRCVRGAKGKGMKPKKRWRVWLGTVLLCWSAALQGQDASHPLDPLTAEEIDAVVEVLRRQPEMGPESRFILIHLAEPKKSAVMAHRPGQMFERRAFASFYDPPSGATHEALVDLVGLNLLELHQVEGVRSGRMGADGRSIDEILAADPRWLEAMGRRGVEDVRDLHIVSFPTLGPEVGPGHYTAFAAYPEPAPYGGFVEGVTAYVDLTASSVYRLEDNGQMPPRPRAADLFQTYDMGAPRRDLHPVRLSQENGPSFEVDGNAVAWQNWRFRFGVHPRTGLELYQVGYMDGEKLRPVLYRGGLSEMVVPYGAPDWFAMSVFDAGQLHIANLGHSALVLGADVPDNASFFNATVHDKDGAAVEYPRAVALYERYGGVLWRHGRRARAAQELVVAFFATVDNYDYGFNWIFRQDGSIEIEVLMTGIMLYRGVEQGTATRDSLSYGTLVAPHIVAPNHQHWFNFRLDMDVDGASPNRLWERNVVGLEDIGGNPTGNAVQVIDRELKSEAAAKRKMSMSGQRRWLVANPGVHNSLGHESSYMLMPGGNSVPYALPGSSLRQHAGFVDAHLWATPYQAEERYAAGDYIGRDVDQGLPRWTAADRSVLDTDLVVWYSLGVTHIPRPEEWPVMPVHRASFKLVPNGFFERNPALDAPPSP
jgi:primary-amine oxidase